MKKIVNSILKLPFAGKMYYLGALAIFAGLVLTIISLLKLCSEQCAEGHNYLLFGFHFETLGLLFFGSLALMHLFQKRNERIRSVESLLFAAGFGSELMFIVVQKYYIGAWCPVCLAIAACVAIGLVSTAAIDIKKYLGGEKMNIFQKSFSHLSMVAAGFAIAFFGVAKFSPMEAAQASLQDQLALGNLQSNIEVYIFTDWECPACRKLEPEIESLTGLISAQAKLIFVDQTIHPESLNFTPYNLSFLLNDKKHYLKLRHMLIEIAKRTPTPSEKEIAAGAASIGVDYKEPHYAEVSMAEDYFKKLGEKFDINSTPTMVIVNRLTKKAHKLVGTTEITRENILESLNSLKN